MNVIKKTISAPAALIYFDDQSKLHHRLPKVGMWGAAMMVSSRFILRLGFFLGSTSYYVHYIRNFT